jgi:uncharacterized membrane protein YdjX (TVP38/TMEM64 family)
MTRERLIFSLLLIAFITSSVLIAQIPSETVVNYVGTNNALILMFVLGLVGGFTTFSGIPYHFVLMSFAAGGVSPIPLGIVTALGVMMGDSAMFTISHKAGTLLPQKVHQYIGRVSVFLKKHPRLLTPALFLYGAFSPFSNDFVVASTGIMGYSYRHIIIPLTIGNMFYNVMLAYLGYYAYDTVVAWL